ncbi:MAG TPA: Hsp20/alpha crystallin family protein, partial [Elusimicrobiota bacterium]|nr:Hsp20/alpha crystallin family protein [Elusimicrobiota bacterium]
ERAGARRHGSSRLRRAPGALVRRVALPEPVRPERASAVLASGVLVVRLPRLRPSRGRRIEIE